MLILIRYSKLPLWIGRLGWWYEHGFALKRFALLCIHVHVCQYQRLCIIVWETEVRRVCSVCSNERTDLMKKEQQMHWDVHVWALSGLGCQWRSGRSSACHLKSGRTRSSCNSEGATLGFDSVGFLRGRAPVSSYYITNRPMLSIESIMSKLALDSRFNISLMRCGCSIYTSSDISGKPGSSLFHCDPIVTG
jgi:hypothetical protein